MSIVPLESIASKLDIVTATYKCWMRTTDLRILYVVLAAIVANRSNADPLWIMLVGSPGSAKTETLRALWRLPNVHEASTITEAGLLSGVSSKDREADTQGGLLREIDDYGVIVCKDFGSVLSMEWKARAVLFAAMREIFDGRWTRHVGADGGRKLHWCGKVAFICGCTGAIDLHHGAMASLGERFIYYRIASDRDARVEQGTAALENIGMVSGMRDELSEAIRDLFDPFPTIPAADFRSAQHREQIVALANLATMARSAVERERYTHEIALVPEPESPTRFSISLSLLFRGMRAIGLEDREAWAVVRKVALDSIPPIRRAALNMLLSVQGPMEMEALKVRAGLKCSSSTLRRALEDLEAHSVVQFVRGDKNKTLWSVTGWAREQHRKGTK